MFLTSLTAAAVAGMLAANSLAVQPDWAESYGTALTRSGERQVPVAVFIAPGGLAKLTDGGLSTDALKTLKTNYVAVQVDPTTESGKKLADAFGVSEGVVLSDGTGKQVALKHEGKVAQTELAGYLTRFADGKSVATTEVHGATAAPAPAFQPQFQQQFQPYPSSGYGSFGGGYNPFGGGGG